MMNCAICGRPLRLYRKENYDASLLDSFAYASRKIPEYMHFALYECKDCRALFASCPIEDKEIFSNYRTADYDSGTEANDASNTYFRYLKKHLPYPPTNALDIGTGNGSYLALLKHQGGVSEVAGVEPSQAPILQAAEDIRGNIINDVFRKELFHEESFDMVSLFQTIEHIPDSLKLLHDIQSIMKNGGCFYLVCHDYRSLVNRVLGAKSPIYDIEHLQIFSKKSVRRLLEKTGFQNIRVFSIRNRYPLSYWIKLFPFPKELKRKLLRWATRSKLGRIYFAINVGNIGAICRKQSR